jgi:hypothetical protein
VNQWGREGVFDACLNDLALALLLSRNSRLLISAMHQDDAAYQALGPIFHCPHVPFLIETPPAAV